MRQAQLPVEPFFSNPLLHYFLQHPENNRLFQNVMEEHSAEDREELERRFSDHYFEMRFLGFVRKHIHYEAQHLLKKSRSQKRQEPLLLNRLVGDEEGTGLEPLDLLVDTRESVEEQVVARTEQLGDVTGNKVLHQALLGLSQKQQLILQLLYVEQMTEQEAAETLGVSQQAINKVKKKSLAQIRRHLESAAATREGR